jgi:hypothetical protein
MAKATLEFDLNDSDDVKHHLRSAKSTDLALVLWDFAYNTRKGLEWEIEQKNLDSQDVLDKVFEKFWEIMEERGIKLDDLIN